MKRKFKIPVCILIAAIVLILAFSLLGTEKSIEGFQITLPDDFHQESSGDRAITLFCESNPVGGILQFDSPDKMCEVEPVNYTTEILSSLQSKNIAGINDPAFDYMMSDGPYIGEHFTIAQLWLGNAEAEYIHYFFVTADTIYDLWFDRSQISTEMEQLILESAVVEPLN